MITDLIEVLGRFIIYLINMWGYGGILVTMAIESACIPLPSEIIMPFAGYLVSVGRFSLVGVTFWGAIGNLLGSWVAYGVGYYGGRPFLDKYGKYFLMHKADIEFADKWFMKYGHSAVFFGRLLPVIRTFISLPAGIVKMDFWKFSLFSFAGSLPWSLLLAYFGLKLGSHWQDLRIYFHQADVLIGIILAICIIWFIKRHINGKYVHK